MGRNTGSPQLKMAFLGKGGAGKSMIAGTVCRYLAQDGRRVLALDVDTVPGLALSLGVRLDAGRLPSGLAELVQGKKGRYWKIRKGAGPASLVDRFAAHGADGIRFLEMGKLPGGVEPSISVAFRHVVEHFRRPGWAMVADLAGGTRQPMFGWSEFAAVRILVIEPSAKSLLTARRLAALATHAVVNMARTESEVEMVIEAIDLPVVGVVPYDEAVREAERLGRPPIEAVPGAQAMQAVAQLTRRLEETA